jgi:acyl-CoA dehydrogenase
MNMWILGVLVLIALTATLLYRGRTKMAWILPIGLALLWWSIAGGFDSTWWQIVTVLFALDVIILGVPAVRQLVVTGPIMRALAKVLPGMSETERIALEAGTVWWDGDLFSGAPDWNKWLRNGPPRLSDRERAFLEGPCEELCRMVDDWDIAERRDLPPEVWDFIRKHRFFAMIIPEAYGGLGFSAQMHSEVVAKLSSRSPTLAVTVMVPNSLGPGELLLHYGTEDQKNHYLPRLASGDEIPCFGLTEPNAGSDAGSMRSYGVIQRGTFQGEEVLGMRLNWDKRYITLAPVATLIGLAFRLFDPEHLLGDTEDLGITVALIPADLPGITCGERHDPLGVPFMNGPTRGEDVFVPLDFIIGGAAMAGQGWMMLMQSLSAGRGISLPSLSGGALQLATRSTAAYASVREQFGLAIGRFEGIQEALARVVGLTYAIDATRVVTAASVDAGEKPSVVSAIAKAYSTESMRQGVTDAVDIFGGAGICLGPRNILARAYEAAPIGITVEGANILTRTMIIFGQGAMRCHPYTIAPSSVTSGSPSGT